MELKLKRATHNKFDLGKLKYYVSVSYLGVNVVSIFTPLHILEEDINSVTNIIKIELPESDFEVL